MVAPRIVTRKQVEAESYIVWNEYVGILAVSNFNELTEIQGVAHLCFWYDSELQNGGHLQYFENHGDQRIADVIRSLQSLGGAAQADVLSKAARRYRSKLRKRIDTVKEFAETALGGEFDDLDTEYYHCSPTIPDLLQSFLKQHRAQFVLILD